MFRGGATAKCRSPKQTTTQHHRTLMGGFHVMTCSCSHGYSHIVAISPSVWLLILSKCGFHVMISCLRSFHTTCKSCYNLFHGFVSLHHHSCHTDALASLQAPPTPKCEPERRRTQRQLSAHFGDEVLDFESWASNAEGHIFWHSVSASLL